MTRCYNAAIGSICCYASSEGIINAGNQQYVSNACMRLAAIICADRPSML
jgi:hypothetical protein